MNLKEYKEKLNAKFKEAKDDASIKMISELMGDIDDCIKEQDAMIAQVDEYREKYKNAVLHQGYSSKDSGTKESKYEGMSDEQMLDSIVKDVLKN